MLAVGGLILKILVFFLHSAVSFFSSSSHSVYLVTSANTFKLVNVVINDCFHVGNGQ